MPATVQPSPWTALDDHNNELDKITTSFVNFLQGKAYPQGLTLNDLKTQLSQYEEKLYQTGSDARDYANEATQSESSAWYRHLHSAELRLNGMIRNVEEYEQHQAASTEQKINNLIERTVALEKRVAELEDRSERVMRVMREPTR